MVNGERKVGCRLHNQVREKRLRREEGRCRIGEMDPNFFWSGFEGSQTRTIQQQLDEKYEFSVNENNPGCVVESKNKKLKVAC